MTTLSIEAFRSRWHAREAAKFQGWTTRYAVIRMFKMPGHKWANKHGRVVTLRLGKETVGGWEYIFEHGEILPASFHGLPSD